MQFCIFSHAVREVGVKDEIDAKKSGTVSVVRAGTTSMNYELGEMAPADVNQKG